MLGSMSNTTMKNGIGKSWERLGLMLDFSTDSVLYFSIVMSPLCPSPSRL